MRTRDTKGDALDWLALCFPEPASLSFAYAYAQKPANSRENPRTLHLYVAHPQDVHLALIVAVC